MDPTIDSRSTIHNDLCPRRHQARRGHEAHGCAPDHGRARQPQGEGESRMGWPLSSIPFLGFRGAERYPVDEDGSTFPLPPVEGACPCVVSVPKHCSGASIRYNFRFTSCHGHFPRADCLEEVERTSTPKSPKMRGEMSGRSWILAPPRRSRSSGTEMIPVSGRVAGPAAMSPVLLPPIAFSLPCPGGQRPATLHRPSIIRFYAVKNTFPPSDPVLCPCRVRSPRMVRVGKARVSRSRGPHGALCLNVAPRVVPRSPRTSTRRSPTPSLRPRTCAPPTTR